MFKLGITVVAIAAVALALATPRAFAQEWNSVFLSKSQAFQHSCIEQKDGQPSHVDKVLTELFGKLGGKALCTKDANLITADNLKNYKLVVFYTQGNLAELGDKDPGVPMGANGVADLLAWIANGGGFMGFHCASDTFHTPEGQPVTPFLEMVGGEFRGHGKQFEGTLKVVDPDHPAMKSIPADFKIYDEMYLFRNYNVGRIHVLALLDPGAERAKQPMYDIPNYPLIWVSELGKGRVYFNALGHREDVWTNPTFQASVIDAAKWAMGEGPTDAEPNFDKVVAKADVDAIQGAAPPPAPAAEKK